MRPIANVRVQGRAETGVQVCVAEYDFKEPSFEAINSPVIKYYKPRPY